jgi:hypothetical protein
MLLEVTIFNKVNEAFNYSGVQIAQWSGLEQSLISRFLNQKSEISVSKFFRLIRSMPQEFQEAFWAEMLSLENERELLSSPKRLPWSVLISEASTADIEEILNAIADRWAELGKSRDKELATV